jgi:hypothetical protein
LYAKKDVPSAILCETLEALLKLSPADAPLAKLRNLGHTICDIVTVLQNRNDIDELRLARLELSFVDVLSAPYPGAPRTLRRLMSTHPELFAEALALCYRSRNDAEEDLQPLTEIELQKCYSAQKLLHCLDSLPGEEQSGAINEDAFRTWCNRVLKISAEGGRPEICDSYIGQLIRHAPPDADGSWPSASVRRVLEEIQSEELANGIFCGIRNSLGVVMRGVGGDQERQLAAKYRSFADSVRFTSPFVARVLDEVAESYEHDGRGWDERDRWQES